MNIACAAIWMSETANWVLVTTDSINYFSEIYGTGCLLLFFTLGQVLSTSFRGLRHELISISCNICDPSAINKNSSAISDKATSLKWWRHRYLILLKTISNFEHCFGPVLLFWTAHIFVTAIAFSYFLVCDFQQENLGLLVITLTRLVVHLFMMAIIPANLHREVYIFVCIRFSETRDETIQ